MNRTQKYYVAGLLLGFVAGIFLASIFWIEYFR